MSPRGRRAPVRPQCRPSGSLRSPFDAGDLCCTAGHRLVCADPDCRVALRRVPVAGGQEWSVVDLDGKPYLDWTPVLTYRLADGTVRVADLHTADGWEVLAELDTARYSAMRALLDLRGGGWYHAHRETCEQPEHGSWGHYPQCCGWPMWAAPGRWQCRISGERFPYAG